MLDPLPRFDEPTAPSIAEIRARSLKSVEAVFVTLVVLCAAVAAFVHVAGVSFGVPAEAQGPIATAFLTLSVADLALLFLCRVWLMRGLHY